MKQILLLQFGTMAFSQTVSINEIDEFTKDKVIQVNCSKKETWSASDNISKMNF